MSNKFHMSTRRKLVISSWTRPTEGNIFGKLEVDVTEAQRYIEHLRATTGEKITLTHLVGKAAAKVMAAAKGLNGRLLFGRYIPHETVDITFLVAIDGGENLAKAKVERTDEKSVVEIAQALNQMGQRLKRGEDDQFKKSQGPLRLLPTWLIRPILFLTGWLTGSLGIEMKAFGLERFPFGSLVITNVGPFGLEDGYAPPTPFARVPVWMLMGAVKKKPVVVDDQIVIRPILPLMTTIDHRFVDGAQLGVLAKLMREGLEQPWTLDGESKPTF